MTKEEYQDAVIHCVLAAKMLIVHDLSALLEAIDRAETVGPFVDPTLYREKAQAMKVATVPLPKRARAVEIKKIPALKKGEIRRVEAIVKGLAAIADRLKIAGVAWSHEGERLVEALRVAQEVSAEALRPQERVALPAPRPAPAPARATGYPPYPSGGPSEGCRAA